MHWWYLLLLAPVVFLVFVMGPLFLGRLFMPRLTLSLFHRFGGGVARLLNLISPELDLRLMVKAGNRYFRKAFADTPFHRRLLFLPFCLRPLDCPADVDPARGVLCKGECPGCEVGKVLKEALGLGYAGVYLVPSSRILRGRGLMPSDQFIRAKIKQHAPVAALGVTCGWHLRHRLLANHKVGRKGYPAGETKAKSPLQGVLLKERNCRKSSVDWDTLRHLLVLNNPELEPSSASEAWGKSPV